MQVVNSLQPTMGSRLELGNLGTQCPKLWEINSPFNHLVCGNLLEQAKWIKMPTWK